MHRSRSCRGERRMRAALSGWPGRQRNPASSVIGSIQLRHLWQGLLHNQTLSSKTQDAEREQRDATSGSWRTLSSSFINIHFKYTVYCATGAFCPVGVSSSALECIENAPFEADCTCISAQGGQTWGLAGRKTLWRQCYRFRVRWGFTLSAPGVQAELIKEFIKICCPPPGISIYCLKARTARSWHFWERFSSWRDIKKMFSLTLSSQKSKGYDVVHGGLGNTLQPRYGLVRKHWHVLADGYHCRLARDVRSVLHLALGIYFEKEKTFWSLFPTWNRCSSLMNRSYQWHW